METTAELLAIATPAFEQGKLIDERLKVEGVKYDTGKTRLELLPLEGLEEVGKVMTYGAKKYDDHNWARGMKWSRCLGAALRHIFAFMRGQDNDPETGLSHLAHATCCLLFVLHYTKHHPELDDRWKPDAQHETRQVVGYAADILEPLFPLSWKALVKRD